MAEAVAAVEVDGAQKLINELEEKLKLKKGDLTIKCSGDSMSFGTSSKTVQVIEKLAASIISFSLKRESTSCGIKILSAANPYYKGTPETSPIVFDYLVKLAEYYTQLDGVNYITNSDTVERNPQLLIALAANGWTEHARFKNTYYEKIGSAPKTIVIHGKVFRELPSKEEK